MAVLFKHIYRHKSEKQKLIINLVNSSNCWASSNDLHPKFTRIHPRNIKKARQKSGMYSMKANKEY